MQNNENSTDELWALWRSGVSLGDALSKFGSQQNVDAYRQAVAHEIVDEKAAGKVRTTDKDLPDGTNPPDSGLSMPATAQRDKQLAALHRLEAEILTRLEHGELIVLGFVKWHKFSDGPVEIPLDIFTGRFGWSQSNTIDGQVLEIGAIRINARPFRRPATDRPRKRPGPWSRRDQVRTVIDMLIKTRAVSPLEKRSPQLARIRRKVLEVYRDDPRGQKGLGHDVIDSELRKRFAELKAEKRKSKGRQAAGPAPRG